MSGRSSRVRVFFKSTSVEGDVEVHMASRLKDEFDRSDRSWLMLANAARGEQQMDDDGETAVNVNRIVCVGAFADAATPLLGRADWGTRFEYDVDLRCDGFEIAGRAHVSIGVSVGEWVSSREPAFIALTNATVTPHEQQSRTFPIMFIARNAIEVAHWGNERAGRG